MNARTTAAAVAVLALALSGCAGGDDDPKPKPSPVSSSATASPSVDRAAARQECIDSWVTALEDGTASAENQPAVCDQVPGQAAQMYAEALAEYNAANRERLEECMDDPSCTEFPRS